MVTARRDQIVSDRGISQPGGENTVKLLNFLYHESTKNKSDMCHAMYKSKVWCLMYYKMYKIHQ